MLLELCLCKKADNKVLDLIDFFSKIFELKFVGNLDPKIQKFLVSELALPYLKTEPSSKNLEMRNKMWKLLAVLYKTKLKMVD